MRTARQRPQGANADTLTTVLAALLAALIAALVRLLWRTIRTTLGLVLIAAGALVTVLGRPWLGLAIALAGAMVYRTQCYRTPFTPCQRCTGTGLLKTRPRRARLARRCWVCDGKGVRIRWGRAAMNAWRRNTYTAPSTPDPAHDARPARAAGPITTVEALRAIHDTRPPRPIHSRDLEGPRRS